MKILIIEDEVMLANSLKALLEGKGFTVEAVYDGESGAEYAELGVYDLLILDVMMPRLDGIEVARRVRAKRCTTPILMLTAREEEADKVLGLELGADDYITKPFVPLEVLARVRSQLRRYAQLGSFPAAAERNLTIGSISLDDRTKAVTVDGEPVSGNARLSY